MSRACAPNLEPAAGAQAIARRCDVRDESSIVRWFGEATEHLGPVSAFVNNAGVLHRAARLDEMERDRLDDVVAVNVVGAFVALARLGREVQSGSHTQTACACSVRKQKQKRRNTT